ncbi:unnamed protein product [Rotaria socialis]|uniref:Uncharacterized protein n=1 Tax=Rotaria socialis TaxID=392032 RepID=A0A818NBH5_9BILA|nr:unnamed protein product [Rotaria socialis]
MPPKRRGGNRGRRKGVHLQDNSNSRIDTPIIITPQGPVDEVEQRKKINIQSEFRIAPLIVEVESLTKVKIRQLIKTHLPGVIVLNIQVNRPNTYTLYSNDVKSFNRLLNELSSIIQINEKQCSSVYILRSIQRIMENNKEAFIKRVDLEIVDDDIKRTLDEKGFKYEKIKRLLNKDKIPTKTIKITFIDSTNRDLFVKLGMQIDSMHFIAEPANHNNKPSQCYKCFKYDHIAKYCKADSQILVKNPICCNRKGHHVATSPDCPKYKEHQQKIQKTIEQYSSSTKPTNQIQPGYNWNSNEDFPILKTTDRIEETRIIELLTEKIMSIVEQATQRIFQTLNQRFEILTNRINKKFNMEIEEIITEGEYNQQESKINKKKINSQYQELKQITK